ncbi:phosphoenolpyruvate--protein phosphotransferase [Mitsuaria sp. PDC51]|jgi:phosphoenolpyruvate-protein phosphotransferase (PTS system enzyme I)|uniref:phosphoenolpyruvate--protein phosphotransferase n=1 Tax=unclassified Roseateles TaxID=2626991 RepID=UPI0008F0631F|nr:MULTISPECIES: phosphoenolpyruvate--protein phosphotransferase [unclassified Roseateles]MBB3284947.1 phosphotransferase system enzyme I (PtsI) [Mitsuaria sp. BK037]MBB3296331.1 phosphotransferase system enzyme I (PtsI) [Mitsuaria sp. BK041]MBB3365546.1 phosphotransferase system enzyme I (PtsI) [Mitsuaria sp. BK045]SFR95681.1 phosphoenolpyruvate--protein phosphotransferase [Mitsuaria sp. PDC51]
MSFQVFGIPVSRGVAIGRAVLVASSRVDVAHYFIGAADAEQEYARLVRGRDAVTRELQALKAELPEDAPHELDALLDVHLLLLNDEALVDAARDWIVDRHYNAEWALSAQLEVLARQFDEMEDDYLRERKADLEQVVERVLAALATEQDESPSGASAVVARDFAGEDPLLLVAADIAPADMIQFKRSVFQGFITDIGGKTSHTAIVARSMAIPAVVGTREASRLIRQDDWVIIDGDAGTVIVNPSPIVLEEYRFRQRQAELENARLARLRHTPAITMDGQRIELHANIELPGDTVAALASGATGVGLFRSEFLFMNREGDLPSEEEQFAAYKSAVEAMAGLPVTIRTVDIGADKPLDRMSVNELRHEHVLNPAMGLRAIRWSLAEPSMFRQQLRAIYRASAFGKVKLLVPMVAHLGEIRQIQETIKRVKGQLDETGQAYGEVQLGVMVEVPAAAIMLPQLLRHVDFVSIGTNDLIQYTLAIDRADEAVAHLYDPWHPAVLHLLANAIAQARAAGKEVSVCGEMAGDSAFTDLLLAMGLTCFSMHPSQIPSVKQRILRADVPRLSAALPRILESDEPAKAALEALAPQSRLH